MSSVYKVVPALPWVGTPPGGDNKQDEEKETTLAEVLTPPATSNAVISLGSNEAQPATSPGEVVQLETSEDPFVATPGQQEKTVVNPAGTALAQISALIAANLSHPAITGIEPPREDRLNEPVSAHNCQGLFVREAKIFVANLSNLRTDDQLAHSVAVVFDEFGPCVVIIKRDRNHQPMGFVQYQLVKDAELAMANANGCTIDGRVIRLEWASARQDLIISLLSNEMLSETEVREVMTGRGPVVSVRPTGPSASEHVSLAWIVEFRYYADCRETIRLMRDDEKYRVVPAPKIQRQAPYPIAAPRTPQGALYHNNDANSVFLGNLPNGITDEELRDQFAYFGTILSCNIISKPLTTGGMNTFAFMEFKFASDAASAACTAQYLRGQPIRVERKQYAQRRASRVAAVQRFTTPPSISFPPPAQQYQLGPATSPYHPATPYNMGHLGFSLSDYHTTPPTPCCVGPYAQFSSPAPRMRQYQDPSQPSPSMQYNGPYHPGPSNYGQMNAIAEEQDGCVFD